MASALADCITESSGPESFFIHFTNATNAKMTAAMAVNGFIFSSVLRHIHETNSPLIVNAYGVLSLALSLQGFETIGRWDPQMQNITGDSTWDSTVGWDRRVARSPTIRYAAGYAALTHPTAVVLEIPDADSRHGTLAKMPFV